MLKQRDEIRYHRIMDNTIADANDEEEVANNWFYYLQDNLVFPVNVTVQLSLRGGKKETIQAQIVEIDPDFTKTDALKVGIVEHNSKRVQFISPAQITAFNTSIDNKDIINDWLYWHDFELLD